MRISFKLNREYDTELIKQLEKFKCNNNLSQIIRKILRDNLVNRKNEIEDVFAEDTNTNDINNTNNDTPASNTDNVEVRNINRKAEINNTNVNTNTDNKSKTIKWNIPK